MDFRFVSPDAYAAMPFLDNENHEYDGDLQILIVARKCPYLAAKIRTVVEIQLCLGMLESL